MPRSDWNILAALAGLAALFVAFGCGLYLASLNYPEEQRYQPYRYASDKPSELDPSASTESNATPPEYRTPCREPKGKDESDLCAQWQAANAAEDNALWAKWGVGITALGAIGLLITIFQGRAGLERAHKANEIARDGNRAWVRFEIVGSGKIWMKPDKLEFSAPLLLKCSGNSPALAVWSDGLITFRRPEEHEILDYIERAIPKNGTGLVTIFPNTEEGTEIEISYNGPLPASARLFVTVFVKYQIIGKIGSHTTAVTYVVKPEDAATKLYVMENDGQFKLDHGAVNHRAWVTLHKGQGGMPIAT